MIEKKRIAFNGSEEKEKFKIVMKLMKDY